MARPDDNIIMLIPWAQLSAEGTRVLCGSQCSDEVICNGARQGPEAGTYANM